MHNLAYHAPSLRAYAALMAGGLATPLATTQPASTLHRTPSKGDSWPPRWPAINTASARFDAQGGPLTRADAACPTTSI